MQIRKNSVSHADTGENKRDGVIITYSDADPRSRFGQVTMRFIDGGGGIPGELIRDDGQADTFSNVEEKQVRGLEAARRTVMASGGTFAISRSDRDGGRYFPEISLECANPRSLDPGIAGENLSGSISNELGDMHV